jgi:methionine synthase II (cobalamin-independent)
MIPRRTNGGVECDTDNGPCACGAWHKPEDISPNQRLKMEFNKEAYKEKMQPYVDKLIQHFKTKGLTINLNGENENVVVTGGARVAVISQHSFYRYSGLACVYKDGKEKNSSEAVEVTDEMWFSQYVKVIIEVLTK